MQESAKSGIVHLVLRESDSSYYELKECDRFPATEHMHRPLGNLSFHDPQKHLKRDVWPFVSIPPVESPSICGYVSAVVIHEFLGVVKLPMMNEFSGEIWDFSFNFSEDLCSVKT